MLSDASLRLKVQTYVHTFYNYQRADALMSWFHVQLLHAIIL